MFSVCLLQLSWELLCGFVLVRGLITVMGLAAFCAVRNQLPPPVR
jgi:hypothetical protein